ncbi:hypothetical protein INT44_002041 [Umbelopsis vinacea]|uniref:Uncharacterized protein n=1 Tax=Umbelopsis vinacea TaxID=44442 RepID=A0A8H7Q5T9_9FUNG|nr:hypothetical protein INT44_002041 [Umbelopsis vinacea]
MFDVFRRKSTSSDTQNQPATEQPKRRSSKSSTYLSYSPSASGDYNSELNRLEHARMGAGIMRCNRL